MSVERFEVLMTLRRYADAEVCARDLIGQYPDWGPAYTHLARALLELKRLDDALEAARVGVAKAPKDAWAHAIVATIHERQRLPREAIRAAKEALRLMPSYSFAYCLLSYNYEQLGKCGDALAATTEGLKHAPQDQELLRFHAYSLYRLNRFGEAEEVARECLRLHATSHESLNTLGLIMATRAEKALFHRLKLHRQADEFYRQALRIQPTLEHTQVNARNNAIACRRWVWNRAIWLPYILVTAIVMGGLGLCCGPLIGWGNGIAIAAAEFAAILFYGFVFMTSDAHHAVFFLCVPIPRRWKIPNAPLNESDGPSLRFWNDWRVVVAMPPLIGIVIAIGMGLKLRQP